MYIKKFLPIIIVFSTVVAGLVFLNSSIQKDAEVLNNTLGPADNGENIEIEADEDTQSLISEENIQEIKGETKEVSNEIIDNGEPPILEDDENNDEESISDYVIEIFLNGENIESYSFDDIKALAETEDNKKNESKEEIQIPVKLLLVDLMIFSAQKVIIEGESTGGTNSFTYNWNDIYVNEDNVKLISNKDNTFKLVTQKSNTESDSNKPIKIVRKITILR